MSLRPLRYTRRPRATRIALKAAEIEKWGCGVASPPASGAALGGEPAILLRQHPIARRLSHPPGHPGMDGGRPYSLTAIPVQNRIRACHESHDLLGRRHAA